MADRITRDIHFKGQASGKLTPADMHLSLFSPQEQKMRAVKSLLIFWLIAAVCILIPIAHFVLVPGFFIGGIIVASRRWKAAEEGHDASGKCPECEKEITVSLDKSAELPQWHDCPECSGALELQAAEQPEEAAGSAQTEPAA